MTTRESPPPDRRFLETLWHALGGDPAALDRVTFTGAGGLPAVYPVTDLAVASVAAAGLALAGLMGAGLMGAGLMGAGLTGADTVVADRRLASVWFGYALRPQGWELPPVWDAVAGDYLAADGWIRLHTNAPHHRAAALAVLSVPAERAAVARAVAAWSATALETAVVAAGGCAAAMRDAAAWAAHPQGRAVAAAPLLSLDEAGQGASQGAAEGRARWRPDPARPLAGVKVLDLTRVLAGPTATRFLAGCGAQVLRIDPPDWEEPALAPDMTLGKRCARLNLRDAGDLATFRRLLAQADVLVHGYRPDALAGLGLDADSRRALNPGLVDICLDAYGWTGPWAGRRGFDSLVQMSCGIADAGMRLLGRDRPTPLPVQALDHATGYILAAMALRGLAHRRDTGRGVVGRTSLAATARLLMEGGAGRGDAPPLAPETDADFNPVPERTVWGPARRLRPPVAVAGTPLAWDLPASPLGSAAADWG
ncbi:CoA transferase [Nitrospirillum sp. BR 11828]|uniref:CoA transferase n=1 Tax=Nitrospirillum sp. BR 11828 TaxID=3104325 RepID=UPI002ACA9CEC|nr:CoA transferase [Nitrospirillum sp. BR 11828]MDZ5648069.1 CoA transferase [Nitrospirillum sp. BR 11828]